MRKIKTITIIVIAVALIAGLRSVSAQSPAKDAEKFLGTVADSVYKNDFFGFRLTLPAEVYVLTDAQKNAFKVAGAELLSKDVAGNKAAWEKAALAEVLLLTVAEKEPGYGTSSLNVGALRQPSGVTSRMVCETAKDFLLRNPNFKVANEIKSVKLAERDFSQIEFDIKLAHGSASVKYLATIVKGHSLTFVITYFEKSQLEVFENILQTLKF